MSRFAQVLFVAGGAAAIPNSFPNPHPHAVQDARDAIATASEIWKAHIPYSPMNSWNWQLKFVARLVDGVWVINNEYGLTITLDAKDGHVITTTQAMYHSVPPK